jgi:YHS domain-containing protein
MAIDLVCHMTVDESTAKFTSIYKGKKDYFCAPRCKKVFEKNPEQYLHTT